MKTSEMLLEKVTDLYMLLSTFYIIFSIEINTNSLIALSFVLCSWLIVDYTRYQYEHGTKRV